MIANLLTVGNAVCGFIAIALMATGPRLAEGPPVELKWAAWLIFLGMVFDMLDGRVARSTGTTSELGAQLDTLADMITFGAAPALIVLQMHRLPEVWPWHLPNWVLWCFCIAYFLGAVLRLARFTVENVPDESAHLCFKGIPSPGAAGLLASLTVFYFYLKNFKHPELVKWVPPAWKEPLQAFADVIPGALPVLALVLGYTMVSNRLRYAHVVSRFLSRRTFDAFAYVIFGLVLLVALPEITLPVVFLVYLLSSPVQHLAARLRARKAAHVADQK
ncbi:MAG TPA: CDP-alcohol phosphatidyltransferase family protein [Planctomycetota bacterium]|jgi:CDP-diacylglycerol--serine O-phosphatidyltransferase|nr:CDP-alcohol phosphatidyltransferase family protein [Planctomycetota bacterium]OQC19530.1 MAG: CDP-alcohol phosphatidyltransferase [Planctomycetes bacterium ADurb.Bin069]HNR99899.1 CDP-alcohol phosphatidyltransferase family protein [Planctomycetota bacterium]HNU26415.1 CDP-alcohol phosphatidyltransferase family protein [Planctomycetota bacterium]HOE31234.1 CDP-alcohol phosphatidyltransferase family protein [Planctomycetota bacterium]